MLPEGPLDGPAVLKYFGVFFNLDKQAEALSSNLTQAYNAAAASYSKGPIAGKPVLAWIQNLGFARAMQHYGGYGVSCSGDGGSACSQAPCHRLSTALISGRFGRVHHCLLIVLCHYLLLCCSLLILY